MENACVADTTLSASYPLDGLDERVGDTRLSAVENRDILSLALPRVPSTQEIAKTRSALEERLKSSFGLQLTDVGARSSNHDEDSLLGLQPGLWFLVTGQQSKEPVRNLKTVVGDTAYVTDQSDSGAILDINGPHAQAALERICSIDIDHSVFDARRVVRTSMEHLSVILERPETERFRLYSPVSSVRNFLYMLRVSLQNVV